MLYIFNVALRLKQYFAIHQRKISAAFLMAVRKILTLPQSIWIFL